MSIFIQYMYNKAVCMIKKTEMTSDDLNTPMSKYVKEIRIDCDILTINQDLHLNFKGKLF